MAGERSDLGQTDGLSATPLGRGWMRSGNSDHGKENAGQGVAWPMVGGERRLIEVERRLAGLKQRLAQDGRLR